MLFSHALLTAMLAATPASTPMDDATLARIVDMRLAGDRTGACMAVAVVEQTGVARAYRCADPADAGRIGADTAFEIGSVSKTMTSILLADLILQGKASLDDPLADYLPAGTPVPDFEGKPILLRHVVTHTSGLPVLPSRLDAGDASDPYANLTEQALLASLGDAALSSEPGTTFAYSNFASMLLSYAVARRAGSDFEVLLKQRLFAPLGMDQAYVTTPPDGVRAAVGHTPDTNTTPAWTFATNLAGVGGVRATLDDMVAYVRGNLMLAETPISPAIALAQQQLSDQPPMAMNWMLAKAPGRMVHAHEGGTGGFSSFVSIDREQQRGVVILSDTTWNSLGSLGSLGLHLVDASFPLGKPRTRQQPSQALLDGLAGEYELQGGTAMTLRQRDGTLFGQAEGQDAFEMAYDDAGDFFPLQFDAILRPHVSATGEHGFTWMQMGAVMPARRVDGDGSVAPVATLSDAQLQAYAGRYPLMPGFVLTIRARDGVLHAQATGQGEFPLAPAGTDRFQAAAHGIEIVFERGTDGRVEALKLHQAGQVLGGRRD